VVLFSGWPSGQPENKTTRNPGEPTRNPTTSPARQGGGAGTAPKHNDTQPQTGGECERGPRTRTQPAKTSTGRRGRNQTGRAGGGNEPDQNPGGGKRRHQRGGAASKRPATRTPNPGGNPENTGGGATGAGESIRAGGATNDHGTTGGGNSRSDTGNQGPEPGGQPPGTTEPHRGGGGYHADTQTARRAAENDEKNPERNHDQADRNTNDRDLAGAGKANGTGAETGTETAQPPETRRTTQPQHDHGRRPAQTAEKRRARDNREKTGAQTQPDKARTDSRTGAETKPEPARDADEKTADDNGSKSDDIKESPYFLRYLGKGVVVGLVKQAPATMDSLSQTLSFLSSTFL